MLSFLAFIVAIVLIERDSSSKAWNIENEVIVIFGVELMEPLEESQSLSIGGDFNNWIPSNDYMVTQITENNYIVEINITEYANNLFEAGKVSKTDTGIDCIEINYKWVALCDGMESWKQVEIDDNGYDVENRTVKIVSGGNSIKDTVKRFKNAEITTFDTPYKLTYDITVPSIIDENSYITMASDLNGWNTKEWVADKIDSTHYKLSVDITEEIENRLNSSSNETVKLIRGW